MLRRWEGKWRRQLTQLCLRMKVGAKHSEHVVGAPLILSSVVSQLRQSSMSFARLAFTFVAGAGSAFAAQNWLKRANAEAAPTAAKTEEKPFLSTIPFKPKVKKDDHKQDDDCPVCTDRTEDFLKQIESIGKAQVKV